MKRIAVIGASSGIGQRIALDFASKGWMVGLAARREDVLKEMCRSFPENMVYAGIDVTRDDCPMRLMGLIDKMGGADVVLLASGVGKVNQQLDPEVERATVEVNCLGFTAVVDTAFRYFADRPGHLPPGRIAVISSIAGTKGLGPAPSYSATKRYQNTYIDALEQLAHTRGLNLRFTDIRPGFIATPLLDGSHGFPMTMSLDHAVPMIEKAIERGKRVAVVDTRWRLITALWRRIPRWIWRRLPLKVKH